ncbi:MAG: thioredoxin domain-containing protein [Halobacteria archaeon]|nr:thioredoxin domain-containing protein [Halobacteria archaeon]
MNRRSFLKLSGVTVLPVLGSGCLSSRNGGGGSSDGTNTFASHASAQGIDDEPRLGSADSGAKIVAFEDPSCPSCERFESTTFPQIESAIEDGKDLAFYFRVYPVVYPWGKPATQALESTYARDENAFWGLKDYYYSNQGEFNDDNVLDRTKEYLAANTQLDADAVVEDARNEAHDSAVQEDLNAGRQAGVRGTPTFFLFDGGSFVTSIAGPQGYSVFENSLGI